VHDDRNIPTRGGVHCTQLHILSSGEETSKWDSCVLVRHSTAANGSWPFANPCDSPAVEPVSRMAAGHRRRRRAVSLMPA
jgi:hypothetical protein